MKTALLAAVALAPALAFADDRPYVVNNGRAAPAAPAAPAAAPPSVPASGNQAIGTTTGVSAFGGKTVHLNVNSGETSYQGVAVPAREGRESRDSFGRTIRPAHRAAVRGVTRRADAPTGGTGSTTQDVPPNFTKPGALIRTEGQLPVYTDPGNARTHSVEGESFVDIDQRKAKDVARAPGVTYGPPDTRPTVNPQLGSGSGVTSNGGVTTNGGGSGSGDGHGHDGGHDNNKDSAPTGTGFDGAF